ncbi:hypothetical protein [Nocardia sp. BMG51109]|uniref:hypothetical protein n=1 Tax=Nocardia sp. BMG51109 TaxID=1056816 RepID=UPI0012EB49C5|nr:hypothetical protein [Nocardia sp. BMG51109]
MVTKKCAFEITIAESLDQARLDHLRGALNLKPDGRLADDWDYKFGHRYLQGEGARATSLTLWRNDDAPWSLRVTYPDGDPPIDTELEMWRREIIDSVKEAGLTPTLNT